MLLRRPDADQIPRADDDTEIQSGYNAIAMIKCAKKM
jgi:hypothetical protein